MDSHLQEVAKAAARARVRAKIHDILSQLWCLGEDVADLILYLAGVDATRKHVRQEKSMLAAAEACVELASHSLQRSASQVIYLRPRTVRREIETDSHLDRPTDRQID